MILCGETILYAIKNGFPTPLPRKRIHKVYGCIERAISMCGFMFYMCCCMEENERLFQYEAVFFDNFTLYYTIHYSLTTNRYPRSP